MKFPVGSMNFDGFVIDIDDFGVYDLDGEFRLPISRAVQPQCGVNRDGRLVVDKLRIVADI